MATDTGQGVSRGVTIYHIRKWLEDTGWTDNFHSRRLSEILYNGGFRVRKLKRG